MSHTIEKTKHLNAPSYCELSIDELIEKALGMALETDEKPSDCLRTLAQIADFEIRFMRKLSD